MPHARLNGTRLYYEEHGNGPPALLLFNGNGLTLDFWGELDGMLAGRARVLRFDQRGSGRTELPAHPFTLETLAADALALLDHLHVDRAVLVGHAFGGRVAQVFARSFPARMAGLVLCGTGGHFPPLPTPAAARLGERAIGREEWETAMLAAYCGPRFREQQPERAQRLLDELWAARAQPTRAGFQREAARATPSDTYWGLARGPALLVYGTEDRFGTPQNADDLAGRMPDARLAWAPGAGHFVIREQPELVFAAIDDFLKEHAL